MDPLHLSFIALLLLSNGYAFVRGGWEGRWVGSLLTLAAFAVPLAYYLGRPILDKSTILFALDAPLLLALGIVAYRSNRYWPLWLTALHLLSVCVLIVTLLDRQALAAEYEAAQAFWSIPMQLILAIGVFLDRRGERSRNVSA